MFFSVFCPAYPPRSVSGLVWGIGALTCVAQDTFPELVVVWFYMVFGVFRVIFLLVLLIPPPIGSWGWSG